MISSTLLRTTVRGTQFVFHLLWGLLLGSICRLRHGRNWHQTQRGQVLVRNWMRRLTQLLGIHIICYGRPIDSQALLVSNHISFLDIVVIACFLPTRYLAKHSIRYWPVIGFLATVTGSLFIRRDKHNQLRYTLVAMRDALNENRPVLFFPEGTTSLGNQVLNFHSGLFQAAIDNDVPVQPLTLHYRHRHKPDRIAAYIGQDNFILNLIRLMARKKTEVHLSFTTPVESNGHSRRSLANFCHARINQNLAYQLQCNTDRADEKIDSNAGILDGLNSEI